MSDRWCWPEDGLRLVWDDPWWRFFMLWLLFTTCGAMSRPVKGNPTKVESLFLRSPTWNIYILQSRKEEVYLKILSNIYTFLRHLSFQGNTNVVTIFNCNTVKLTFESTSKEYDLLFENQFFLNNTLNNSSIKKKDPDPFNFKMSLKQGYQRDINSLDWVCV